MQNYGMMRGRKNRQRLRKEMGPMLIQLQGTMLELLAKGADAQTIIDTGASLLHNPIVAADMRFRIPYMSHAEHQGDIELWTRAKEEGYISDNVLQDLQRDDIIRRLKNSGEPIFQPLPNGFQSVRYPIFNQENYCGFVGMYDYVTPFTPQSTEALSAVAKALSAISAFDPNFAVTENQYYEEELFQLLCCETADKSKAACGRLKKKDFPQWKILCLVEAHSLSRIPIEHFKKVLGQRIAPPAMTLYKDRLAVLLDSFSKTGGQANDPCGILEELCDPFKLTMAKSFPYQPITFTHIACRIRRLINHRTLSPYILWPSALPVLPFFRLNILSTPHSPC